MMLEYSMVYPFFFTTRGWLLLLPSPESPTDCILYDFNIHEAMRAALNPESLPAGTTVHTGPHTFGGPNDLSSANIFDTGREGNLIRTGMPYRKSYIKGVRSATMRPIYIGNDIFCCVKVCWIVQPQFSYADCHLQLSEDLVEEEPYTWSIWKF